MRVIVFKELLDGVVREVCRVDESWNFTGNQFVIENIRGIVHEYNLARPGSVGSIDRLLGIFTGQYFWAEEVEDATAHR